MDLTFPYYFIIVPGAGVRRSIHTLMSAVLDDGVELKMIHLFNGRLFNGTKQCLQRPPCTVYQPPQATLKSATFTNASILTSRNKKKTFGPIKFR